MSICDLLTYLLWEEPGSRGVWEYGEDSHLFPLALFHPNCTGFLLGMNPHHNSLSLAAQ